MEAEIDSRAQPGANVSDAIFARPPREGRPHVVVVGAGFGGITLVKALAHAPVRITLIDRRNHHLFQPLLYQVATAGLSPAQIAAPIRGLFRDQRNVTVELAEVTGVDAKRREVAIGERRIAYDYLVLATGARHSYFGHDEWASAAPGLKTIEDATEIRRRILLAFEEAELEENALERKGLMTFVVIGGGPTGVELAGKIVEIARRTLRKDFRRIDPTKARVILVEGAKRLLLAFPEELSNDAQRRLERLGVEVRLGEPVTACDAAGVDLGKTRLPARTIVWAAGVAASPAARWLGVAADRAGRAIVEPDLSVAGLPNVFVIGDTASAKNPDGAPVPGLAVAAKQEGKYVAGAIIAKLAGRVMPRFAYRNLGNLATVGRNAAVIDLGVVRLTGFTAWVSWSIAHIYFLNGFRNRFTVTLDWLWSYLTHNRSARLIVGNASGDAVQSSARTKT